MTNLVEFFFERTAVMSQNIIRSAANHNKIDAVVHSTSDPKIVRFSLLDISSFLIGSRTHYEPIFGLCPYSVIGLSSVCHRVVIDNDPPNCY